MRYAVVSVVMLVFLLASLPAPGAADGGGTLVCQGGGGECDGGGDGGGDSADGADI